MLPPYTLADIADFYLAEHIGPLAARTQNLAAEEGAFVRILLEVLPRGGLSPEDDTTVQRFRQRYPNSSYGYVLRGFQEQEKVKMSLRAWHERQAREFYSFHGTTPVDGAEYKLSRFRYGLDFHSGTGFFTSGLNQAFRPLFNFGHGFEFGWDRYMLYLRNYIGTAETRAPYTYDGRTWPTGLRLNYYVPEISLGFRVVESKRLLLTPFAGISWLYFAPAKSADRKNPALDTDVSMGTALTAGLNLDVLLWRTESGTEVGSWMLKIRSGVRAAQAQQSPATRGTLLYLDVGIGGFGRQVHFNRTYARKRAM